MRSNFLPKWAVMIAAIALLLMQSCGSDPAPTVKAGQSGFFVVNEGLFGSGNASVSFYDRKTDAVTNNVFSIKNGRPLGDQAQSMTVFENKGYIVVQNSAKVEVINTDDYSSIATISSDLPNPRYFIGISSTKAYVSDWGLDGVTGTIKVIDLTTFKVTKAIPIGHGPNQMLKVSDQIYVTNNGGYGYDNTLKIIDTGTDAVTATINVGDNPNSLQRDKDGNIWVASTGIPSYQNVPPFDIDPATTIKGTLTKLNANNVVTLKLTLGKASSGTIKDLSLSPDGATLYYNFDDNIYSMSIAATILPTAPFKTAGYYGLAIDPFNGNVIGCRAPSFSAAGSIDVFDPSGNLIKNYQVGIAPNGCAFK